MSQSILAKLTAKRDAAAAKLASASATKSTTTTLDMENLTLEQVNTHLEQVQTNQDAIGSKIAALEKIIPDLTSASAKAAVQSDIGGLVAQYDRLDEEISFLTQAQALMTETQELEAREASLGKPQAPVVFPGGSTLVARS